MSGPARRVAITGASGFLGGSLARRLTAQGDVVQSIGRGATADVHWDPTQGTIAREALQGVEAVVHLAGSSIAVRWTAASRREIRESRVLGTRLIAETCAKLTPRPSVLVCTSAIGIYGSRGDEWLDERSSAGNDFLAEVGRVWEGAAAPARDAGIRVVHPRIGIVLSPDGGALAKMLPPFRAGIGGRLGQGTQWMSWVGREDLLSALDFATRTAALTGPVNVVAPEPVTNATFVETLGRVLQRPTVLPVPALALQALFGEMAVGTILASQRVRSGLLERAGFRFRYPTLSSALRFELGLP